MHRVVAALVAAVLSTVGTALAQVPNTGALPVVTSDLSNGWVGDEPNTPAGGSLPYCYDRDGEWVLGDTSDNAFPPTWGPGGTDDVDPSCAYGADVNGLPRPSSGSAGRILNGEWRSDVCVNRLQPCYAGASKLFTRLGLGTTVAGQDVRLDDVLVPGPGQWWAWFGTFEDLNDNGWIEDHLDASRVEVGLRGECANRVHNPVLTTPPPFGPADPNGLGTPQGVNTGVSVRCHQNVPPDGDEWTGDNSAKVVFYVTPGDYNEAGDFLNRAFVNDTVKPDCYAQARAAEGEPMGQYFCPTTNFDHVVIDNGVLETTVLEVISNPVPGTVRQEVFGAGSRRDVDVHTSINPDLEALYEEVVVQNILQAGCDVEWTALGNACPVLQQRLLQVEHDVEDVRSLPAGCTNHAPPCSLTDVQQSLPSLDPFTGPVNDLLWPNWATETPPGVNYNDVGGHLYFDQRLLGNTQSRYATISAQDTGFGEGGIPGPGMSLADGRYHAILQTEVHAYVGVWEDDGDGVIGDWTEDSAGTDGCPDLWDCGNDNDPNEYGTVASNGEFTPVCGTKATDAINAPGSYYATLTPTPSWVTGVYLMTDRDVLLGSNDPLIDDGRSTPFNPYDDAALDLLGLDAHGDPPPKRLNLYAPGDATAIQIHMICDGGFYAGYERLVFPVPNITYSITLTGSVTYGSETRSDTDAYGSLV